MRFARRVEQALDSVVDRVAGRVFPGGVQPDDLAGRVVRVVDLGVTHGELGPTAPNRVGIRLHPDDLGDGIPTDVLERALSSALEEEAAHHGWRLGGPAKVTVRTDPGVPRGAPDVRAGAAPGPRPPWGVIALGDVELLLADNRLVLGRSAVADVRIPDDSISRRHALLWREGGRVLIKDLGSANGTFVDGTAASKPTVVGNGTVLTLGTRSGMVLDR